MTTYAHLWQYLSEFFLEWEIFSDKSCSAKTYILLSVALFRKSCLLWDNVEKHCRAGQDADDSVDHAHWILDT
jgi:hypothetical protein